MDGVLMRLALAAVSLATLTGCPPREPGGGGGGPVGQGQGPDHTTNLSGDQLLFARAYARAPWAVANLGAGDWGGALRDVTYMQDQIVALKRSTALTGPARQAIAGLQPRTDALAILLQRRDPAAMPLAAGLVEDYGRVAVRLSDSGWLSAGWGGGAGTGTGPTRPEQTPAPGPTAR